MKYEEILTELENIGKELENPKIALDKALELFEKSVEISKIGFDNLAKASGKITILKQELDKIVEKPFE